MRKQKRYKCPFCVSKVYKNFGAWATHMETMHNEQIPKEWTPARYLYFMQTGMREGHCVVCKKPSDWNEATQKYERYCKNPACKQSYIKTAKKRMVDKYGKEYILTEPDRQRKMQAAKKMSGKYKFQDGGEVAYVGTYEKDFLEMLDTFGFSSNDIIGPSPNTYFYLYNNPKEPEKKGKHFYIPDFFIPSLNLEIEIKTQLNMHHKIQDIDKVKEYQKDDMMNQLVARNKINYLKLSDKDYTSFFHFILELRDLDTKEDLILQSKSEGNVAIEEYVDPRQYEIEIGLDQFLPDTDDFIEIPIDDISINTYNITFPGLNMVPLGGEYKVAVIKNAFFGNYLCYYCINVKSKDLLHLEVLPEFQNLGYEMAIRNFLTKKYHLKEQEIATEGRITYTDEGHDTIIQLEEGEKPFGVENFLKVMNLDFFVISDTHVMTFDEANKLRFASIVKSINDAVGENDKLLFLGDLGGKRGYDSLEDTTKFVKTLTCKNIYLVLGNHDSYKISDYKNMGFKMVTDRVTWKNILFSHVPERVGEGMVNVHGHNHGTECYINDGVSADDHVDVYNEMFIPSRLRDLLNKEKHPERIKDPMVEDTKPQIDTSLDDVAQEAFDLLEDFFTEFNAEWDAMPHPEDVIAEEAYETYQTVYPVYIVLMHTNGSPISKITKKLTKDEWTHSNIAFNIKLDPMYTMGSKSTNSDGPRVGFNLTSPRDDFFRDGIRAKYGVYYMEVDKKAYRKIQSRLNFFLEHKYYFRYDWKGIVRCFFKLPTHENRKFFCSSLVANIIGTGVDLPMDSSLYKPQDLVNIYDKVFLIDKGDDFFFYDWQVAQKNLDKIKEETTIGTICSDNISIDKNGMPSYNGQMALEALGGEKKTSYLAFWRSRLFSKEDEAEISNLIGRRDMPKKSKYLTLKKVLIDEKEKVISIQHINCRMLLNRIAETYDERKLEYIFDLMYNAKDIEKFRRKHKHRSSMKIEAIQSPLFFAMELNILFSELADKYNDRNYRLIARAIYDNTWLGKCDKKEVTPISKIGLGQLNPDYKLKDHQLQFIELYPQLKARLNLNGYILAFDQGLGKTLTATALSLCLNSDQVFIVCPNSLKMVWKSEISKYIQKYKDNPLLADKEVVICDKKAKNTNKNPRFVITNNESISLMYPYTGYTTNAILIVDEMHNFRNVTGQRSEELFTLKSKIRPRDILLMSGTPMKATPNELVPSLKLLDPLFNDAAAAIYNKCFNLNDTMAMSVVRKRFGYIMYRKTKEILDLPSKTVQDLRFTIQHPEPYYMTSVRQEAMNLFTQYYEEELNKNQEYRDRFVKLVEYYSTATQRDTGKYINWIIKTVNTSRNMAMHEIDQMFIDTFVDTYVKPNIRIMDDLKTIKSLESKFIRMEQSCLGRALGKIYPPRRNEVYTALYMENKDIINEMIVDRTKKTVIFSQFLEVINTISKQLTKDGIKNVSVVGGTNNRMELIDQFKHDDETMVILATSQTLGTGVTLIEADQMFFFGPPWRSTDFDQCCDRIYRIGQNTDVIIYNVILDTTEYNLTDHMNKILNWSGSMFGAAISEAQLDGTMESLLNLIDADMHTEEYEELLETTMGYGEDVAIEQLTYHPEYFI